MRQDRQWQPALAAGDLQHSVVQIWRVSLDGLSPATEALQASLAPDERERVARFHFERDRRRYIVTRAALRALLGQALTVPAAEVCLQYETEGKPRLADTHDSDVQFNVAHSHELALVALARGAAVGVDVEHARELDDAPRIAQRFFSRQEVAALLARPAAQRQALFFRIWARKEAFIKATGKGLAQPLGAFNVVAANGEPLSHVELDGAGTSWQLCDLPAGDEYGAALVVWAKQAKPTVQLFQY